MNFNVDSKSVISFVLTIEPCKPEIYPGFETWGSAGLVMCACLCLPNSLINTWSNLLYHILLDR